MGTMRTDRLDLRVVAEALSGSTREPMVEATSVVEARMEELVARPVEEAQAKTVPIGELVQAAATKVDMSIKEIIGEDIRAITSRTTIVLDRATSSNIRGMPMLRLHQLCSKLRPMIRHRHLISLSQALVVVFRIRK